MKYEPRDLSHSILQISVGLYYNHTMSKLILTLKLPFYRLNACKAAEERAIDQDQY